MWQSGACDICANTSTELLYLSNEGVSLIENATHLGLPVPVKLKQVLEQLHDRAEKTNSVTTTPVEQGNAEDENGQPSMDEHTQSSMADTEIIDDLETDDYDEEEHSNEI